jgi:hypothetical protein
MATTNSNRPSSYQKLTYIQKVARINRRLRQGDISNVAEQTGYSSTHVSDVLNGNEFNDMLVNRAWDIARNRISNAVKIQKMSTTLVD